MNAMQRIDGDARRVVLHPKQPVIRGAVMESPAAP